ncbi:MAG: isoaspartyl peptidase/L-asparaginase family protein [Flavobacteriaceae bacterium]
MNKLSFSLLMLLYLFYSCNSNKVEFAIVIHGGAGTILKKNMSDEMELAYKLKLEEAINAGYNILEKNGSSKDAVEETIKILENSELFNAGKGSVLSNKGVVEMDASIMNGQNLNAGAISGIKTIKNPISAARLVMEKSEHVFLSGEGAEEFAKLQGLDIIDNEYFITETRLKSLLNAKKRDSIKDNKFGTVGCVAIDKFGNITSGTSTGGMTNKKWNRIGDVPIIGAGTYANNNTCGISSTGWGEYFIRNVVAYDISSQIEYKKISIDLAAKNTLKKVKDLGGNGGVIGIDKNGNILMDFNTEGMYRGYKKSDGESEISIYK